MIELPEAVRQPTVRRLKEEHMKIFAYETRPDEQEQMEALARELGVELETSGAVPGPDTAARRRL